MSDLDQLLLQGEKVTGDLRDALAEGGVDIEQTMAGVSIVRFDLLDDDRTFADSDVFNQQSMVQIDDVRFALFHTNSPETSPLLTLEWKDWIVTALRAHTGTVTAAAGTTTRGEFAKRLADEAGVGCEFEPGETIRTQVGRGITNPEEDSWDALTRLASDVNRRCFSDGTTLLFGSDDWLRARTTPQAISEYAGGIGRIGFNIQSGLPADTATFTVVSRPWTHRPGHPVDITKPRPAAGEWLVGRVARNALTGVTKVTLTRAQQPLPEPEHDAVTPNGADGTVYDFPGSSRISPDFVAVAMGQNGKPYVFGAEAAPSDPSPRAFDCSELVEWSLARVGIRFVDGSGNQATACRNAGRIIPIADAVRTYGALLFRTPNWQPGHVAISRGDGTTIEARGRNYGTGVFSATAGRAWTHGGLVPGVTYQ